MGRWAQYRHRGRGSPTAVSYPLGPPEEGAWSLASADDVVQIIFDGETPAPATGAVARWRLVDTEIWTGVDYFPTAGVGYIYGAGDGNTVEVQTAWATATEQLSDWSGSLEILVAV